MEYCLLVSTLQRSIILTISSLPLEERSALKHIDGDSKLAMSGMSTLQTGVPFLRYIANISA